MCPVLENLDQVYQKTSNSQSQTHFRSAEYGSRQAIQARPDHPNRVVSPPRGFPKNLQQVAPASNRPICHEVQQQDASVCVTGTGPLATAVDALSLSWMIWVHTPSHQPYWAKWWRSCRTPHADSDYSGVALKGFQDFCSDKIVLVATDNTTLVSYINKEGGMRLGPLCALLWRILTWCTTNQVTLKARHRPAKRGSRPAIQARPDHPNRVVSPSSSFPAYSAYHGRIWTHTPSHR